MANHTVKEGVVDAPWYPADVRAGAMEGLADLFTSTKDNYLFPSTRYVTGHDMSFVLRPGEKLTRFFQPETPSLFYLPYAYDGKQWREFPTEIPRYRIRTADGPRSQKDDRRWGTGRIEYTPPQIGDDRTLAFEMPSQWVVIDAKFTADVKLASAESSLSVETSMDGRSWLPAGRLTGPFNGTWSTEPHVITRSANGRLTAVTGSYGYWVRFVRSGPELAAIRALTLTSRIQINPRTLPALAAGENHLVYTTASALVRKTKSLVLQDLQTPNLRVLTENGQTLLCPGSDGGEKVVELDAASGFDFGARFIEIRNGLAPDKLTAEVRTTAAGDRSGAASIEWSTLPAGPWRKGWTLPSPAPSRDGKNIERVLRWPEVNVSIRSLPKDTHKVYVRIRTSGPCVDNVRSAVWEAGDAPTGKLRVTHAWTEGGVRREHSELISATEQSRDYNIKTVTAPRNESVTFEMLQ